MSNLLWIHNEYDQIIRDYSGKYILYDSKEILYADESFDVVYERYKKIRKTIKCKMVLVDEGEATLYGFKIQIKRN